MLLNQHSFKTSWLLILTISILFTKLVAADESNDNDGDDGDDPTAVDASTARDCTDNYQIRNLRLVLSWGPGICSTKVECRDPTPDFTVHGFWPKFLDTTETIRCCTRERFDRMVLNPYRQNMDNWWPALNSMNSEDFWSYQWEKHGRCMNKIDKINTVFNYFYFALLSFKQFQIKNVLIQDGFEPDNEETYMGSEMVESIRDAYGFKVELDCARVNSQPELRTLTEITICFDKNLYPTDCPYSKSRCLKRIVFPSSVI